MLRRVLFAAAFVLSGCRDHYRIGEYVWVEWEGRDFPAYIVEQKTKSKVRVHFDGYDSRWDEDVTPERIKGKIEGTPVLPPPPDKVARALGILPKPTGSAGAPSAYVVNDRVRVRWRGSNYVATIVAITAAGNLTVHYEGYGSEWDETIPEDRITGKR
jgi:hypothetical protein